MRPGITNLDRTFAPHEHAVQQAVLVRVVVKEGAMHRGPIVPDQHIARAPFMAVDELWSDRAFQQIVEQRL